MITNLMTSGPRCSVPGRMLFGTDRWGWGGVGVGVGGGLSLVTSIFLNDCESWTLTAELQRIQAMEMRCYRKIHISYKDHVTNEEVRAKIQQAVGPHEDLLTIVKRRKLQ